MKKIVVYACGGRLFSTKNGAIRYANFIAKVSRLIVSVEEVAL